MQNAPRNAPGPSRPSRAIRIAASILILGLLASCGTIAKVKKTLGGCPPYQEEVAFSNYQPVKAVAAKDPAKKVAAAKTPDEKKSEKPAKPAFGLPQGSLQKLGQSTYLDQMFNGIKEDFDKSGMKMRKIEQGFQAKGLKLQKIIGPDGKTKGLRIALDGTIGFKLGSAAITPIARRLIAKVAKAMKAYPETTTAIGGHVDCCASRRYSLWLSQARANSAKKELINVNGLAASRVTKAVGYADDRMLIPVRRLEPRNRRVEFVINTK